MRNIKATYKGRGADEMVFKADGKYYYFDGYEPRHDKGDTCTISVNKTRVSSIKWD